MLLKGKAEGLERAAGGKNTLAEVIREYLLVCHRMNDHILLIYQEAQSLPPKWRKRVLDNEVRITGLFTAVLVQLMAKGGLPRMNGPTVDLIAHNIAVLGHMWTFRRWFLANHYGIDEQAYYVMPLMTGVTPEALRPLLLEKLSSPPDDEVLTLLRIVWSTHR